MDYPFRQVRGAVPHQLRDREVEAVSSLRLLPRRGEELIATWLGEDRENWPVFLLTLVDPWQERPGIWSAQTPEWVRTLGTIATTAHVKQAPRTLRCCNSACPDPSCIPSGDVPGTTCTFVVCPPTDVPVKQCQCLFAEAGEPCGSDHDCSLSAPAIACICGTCQVPPPQGLGGRLLCSEPDWV